MSLIKSNNERNGLNVTSFKNEMKETHKTSEHVSFLADGNDDIMLFCKTTVSGLFCQH